MHQYISYKVFSLRKLIYRKHRKETEHLNQSVNITENDIDYDSNECDTENNLLFETENPGTDIREDSVEHLWGKEIHKFLLELRVKRGITEQSSEAIAVKFKELISQCLTETKSSLSNVSSKLSSDELSDIINPLQNLSLAISKSDSVYKQNEFIKQGPYVEPVSINIGTDKIVYVPILDNLKTLLAHEDILSCLLGRSKSSVFPGHVCDFNTAEKCQKSSFFSSPNTLQINLYIDDFVLTNPLGTSAKSHKICAIYYIINNIPFALRSKVHNIQLACLFPSSLIKNMDFN